MAKVIVDLTVSLDGFVAGAGDGPQNPLGAGGEGLFRWYFDGETPIRAYEEAAARGVRVPPFRLSRASAEVFGELVDSGGAVITGRRTYDIAGAWGGNGPVPGVPVFVLTHRPPSSVPVGESAYTFTDDISTAVAQASAAAGDRYVSLMGASPVRECLRLGLLDEIQLHVVPLLLGGGVRLFDQVPAATLEKLRVVDAPGVTHLRYRVVR
ncbi:dihydrofolate reductase family protein [Asanoa iriomotensis]|uniref:Riboflavin biosynthesis protein n=1 Tax=Asanoa iriomotensis TaxID=234613 RepID=A0ABQ4BXC9_9ACTN|nr:dihydrofolate reductase family protein [Asanoa iriomotensis]GIF54821.1 riboflavin biosynthesis protein [Asanoa iriomotensis]